MRLSAICLTLLLSAIDVTARHSLAHAGRNVKGKFPAVVRDSLLDQSEQQPEKRASPQFLNSRTAKFAVDSSKLPDINFDIGESYAGSLPISSNPKDPNQLFFWFFPSTNPAAKNEITIWLNGGPGCSSMGGIISESGVFTWYGGTFAPVRNPFSFNNLTNVVYIDQPVGSGFSPGTVSIHNEEELAAQFLGFWKNFVDTFSLHGRKTYVTGESYAGMYCPYIANAMIEAKSKDYFNVQGMMIFDPVIAANPIHEQIPYVAFTDYWGGLFPFNDSTNAQLHKMAESCGYQEYLNKYLAFPPAGHQPSVLPGSHPDGSPLDGCDILDAVFDDMMRFNPCWDIYHVATKCPLPWDNLGFPGTEIFTPPGAPLPYFNRPEVKAAIHAPNISWQECNPDSAPTVFLNGTDTSLPSISVIPSVVENTKNVIIGHGSLDGRLIANGTLLGIQNMTWGGKLGFQRRPTSPFYVPYADLGDPTNWAGAGVFGTTHSERGLTWVEVAFAGHQIPEFAPSAAYRILEGLLGRVDSLSSTKPFSTCPFPQSQQPLGHGNAEP